MSEIYIGNFVIEDEILKELLKEELEKLTEGYVLHDREEFIEEAVEKIYERLWDFFSEIESSGY